MTTRLDHPLKREVLIEGAAYTLTLDESGFKLVAKGKRLGYELKWADIVTGDAGLAAALQASVAAPNPVPIPTPAKARTRARTKTGVKPKAASAKTPARRAPIETAGGRRR